MSEEELDKIVVPEVFGAYMRKVMDDVRTMEVLVEREAMAQRAFGRLMLEYEALQATADRLKRSTGPKLKLRRQPRFPRVRAQWAGGAGP